MSSTHPLPAAVAAMVQRRPELAGCAAEVARAGRLLAHRLQGGGKVLVCGNGGSAADSEHFVAELMKGFLKPRPLDPAARTHLLEVWPEDGKYLADHLQGALPAISLVSQTSLLTAYANDVAADMVFAQQVWAYGTRGDALLAISTSGTSPSVLHATRVARARDLLTIGLTGDPGGELAEICEVPLRVPARDTTSIQELHLPVLHTLAAWLEETCFP